MEKLVIFLIHFCNVLQSPGFLNKEFQSFGYIFLTFTLTFTLLSGDRAATTAAPFNYLCCTPSSRLSMHCKCNTNCFCLLKLYHDDREIWLLGLHLKMPAWWRMWSNKTAATCWRDLGEQILPCASLDKLEETQSIRDTGQRKAEI